MRTTMLKQSSWLVALAGLWIFLPGFHYNVLAQSIKHPAHCRKFVTSSYHLTADQTLLLQEDLSLYSKGDVRIDGDILGQKIKNSNADGQNLSIHADGDIIINGNIWLSDGGEGQMVPLTPALASPLLISNALVSKMYSGKKFHLEMRDGGKGGGLILEGRRIIIRGKIRVGNGGNGVAGGNGGDGGKFLLESQLLLSSYYLKAGNGGNGGNSTPSASESGNGGDGGRIDLFTCVDGTAGVNGNSTSIITVPAQSGTDGGTGGTDNDGVACHGGKGGDGGNSTISLGGGNGGMGGNGGQATNTLTGGSALGGNGGNGGKGGNSTLGLGGAGGKGGNGGNGIGANGSIGGTCTAANGGNGSGGSGGNGGNGGDSGGISIGGGGGNGGNGGVGTGGNAGSCIAVSCSTPSGGVGTGGTAGTGGTRGTGVTLGMNGSTGTPGTATNGSSGSCTLPIELLHFQATKNATQVQLTWSTATEINNDYMAIERSADGSHFIELGRIKGKGTTNETQHYNFTDENPLQGNNYYRLRQVDYDQTTDHSKVIALHFDRGQVLSLFPNPAREKVYLQTPLNLSAGKVYLLDALGKKFTPALEGATGWYELTLPNHLPKGHYWVIIQNEKEVMQTLLIKE